MPRTDAAVRSTVAHLKIFVDCFQETNERFMELPVLLKNSAMLTPAESPTHVWDLSAM